MPQPRGGPPRESQLRHQPPMPPFPIPILITGPVPESRPTCHLAGHSTVILQLVFSLNERLLLVANSLTCCQLKPLAERATALPYQIRIDSTYFILLDFTLPYPLSGCWSRVGHICIVPFATLHPPSFLCLQFTDTQNFRHLHHPHLLVAIANRLNIYCSSQHHSCARTKTIRL